MRYEHQPSGSMRQLQFIRSNTFRWASAVAAVFALFMIVLFGFIYWKIDGYLIARSDRMIAQQLNFMAALPRDRRAAASRTTLARIPEAFSMRDCSILPAIGLPATSESCRGTSPST